MITIWNSAKLARRLRDEAVSERQKFAYYFIIFFFVSLMSARSFSTYVDAPLTVHDYIIDGISIIAFVIGALLMFRANQSGDGRNFIERAVCIMLPASVQTLVLILVIYLPVALYEGLAQGLSGVPAQDTSTMTAMQTTAFDTAVATLAFSYYYYRMIRSVGIASGARAGKEKA